MKEKAIRAHLLNCNNILSLENRINKKFVLEINENLLSKRDRPILNKNITRFFITNTL